VMTHTGGVAVGTVALATNATKGFLSPPTCAGVPSGVPLALTGTTPTVVDSTNDHLYMYGPTAAAWLKFAPTQEGSWTPGFGGSVTDPTVTYTVQDGRYTKIGKLVNVSCRLTISAIGAAGAGDLFITGLPFTVGSTNNAYRGGLTLVFCNNFSTTGSPNAGYPNGGTTTSRLYRRFSADARDNASVALAVTDITATSTIALSGHYYID
jgi:hypothetical protein